MSILNHSYVRYARKLARIYNQSHSSNVNIGDLRIRLVNGMTHVYVFT